MRDDLQSNQSHKAQLPSVFSISTSKIDEKENSVNIKKIMYKESTICLKAPNNVVLLKNFDFLQVEKIVPIINSNEILITGKILEKEGAAYEYPISSLYFNIFKIKNNS